jgi:hypothetical protein
MFRGGSCTPGESGARALGESGADALVESGARALEESGSGALEKNGAVAILKVVHVRHGKVVQVREGKWCRCIMGSRACLLRNSGAGAPGKWRRFARGNWCWFTTVGERCCRIAGEKWCRR